jgi:hypothetical protein
MKKEPRFIDANFIMANKRNNYLSVCLLVYLSALCVLFIYAPTRLPMYLPGCLQSPDSNTTLVYLLWSLILPDGAKLLLVAFFLPILGLLLRVQTCLSPKYDTHFMNSAVFYYGKIYSDFSAYS